MKMFESKLSDKTLWRMTTMVAVLLLVFTILLVIKDRSISSSGFTGYISQQDSLVYLRSQPDETSRTVAILNPGSVVFVDHSTDRDNLTWYHVKSENGIGWIQEENLTLTPP
jgi:hypothetical protein